jgi:transcription elongation factor SPT5
MVSDYDTRRRVDDDSEDEEDFNPAPADMSDEEGHGDADEQIRREARDSSPVARSRDEEGDELSPVRAKSSPRRHSGDGNAHGGEEDEDEDEAEDEDEGRRKRRRLSDDDEDEDEEEDDDDDEDAHQVCCPPPCSLNRV